MTKEQKQVKAFKYYCMGLNSKEIGKLLDLSHRTIQGYMTGKNWKQKKNPKRLQDVIHTMHLKRKSYTDIAKELGVCRSTVYASLKRVREQAKQSV